MRTTEGRLAATPSDQPSVHPVDFALVRPELELALAEQLLADEEGLWEGSAQGCLVGGWVRQEPVDRRLQVLEALKVAVGPVEPAEAAGAEMPSCDWARSCSAEAEAELSSASVTAPAEVVVVEGAAAAAAAVVAAIVEETAGEESEAETEAVDLVAVAPAGVAVGMRSKPKASAAADVVAAEAVAVAAAAESQDAAVVGTVAASGR